MSVTNYLERPTVWQCAQWDGTNNADMSTVLTAVGWSWTTDASGAGYAVTPTGGQVEIVTGTWIATGGGSIQFLDATAFPGKFTPGSAWAVAP